jgi:membrane fusion protein
LTSPLFRAQVRAHVQDAWLGRIVLIRPVSFTFFCTIAAALTIAMLAYLGFGEYTRKARVGGVLAPEQGVVKIVAQQAGVVDSVLAREGDRIARDAMLLTVVDGRAIGRSEDVASALRTHFY